jgi:hypothetical protein
VFLAIVIDLETRDRLTALARELDLRRSSLCRRLLRAALASPDLQRWIDAVLGPRFEFAQHKTEPRSQEATEPRRDEELTTDP